MEVAWPDEVNEELDALPKAERVAMGHAFDKLEVGGAQLGFPHTSAVQGSPGLRELRPRSGQSPWRSFYRRIGDLLFIASVGPEAGVDPRGFRAAVETAEVRIAAYQRGVDDAKADADD